MDDKIAFLRSLYPLLTIREAQIIAHIIFTSDTNKMIAVRLGISERTIKNTVYQCSDETLDTVKCPKIDVIRERIINELWNAINPPL